MDHSGPSAQLDLQPKQHPKYKTNTVLLVMQPHPTTYSFIESDKKSHVLEVSNIEPWWSTLVFTINILKMFDDVDDENKAM